MVTKRHGDSESRSGLADSLVATLRNLPRGTDAGLRDSGTGSSGDRSVDMMMRLIDENYSLRDQLRAQGDQEQRSSERDRSLRRRPSPQREPEPEERSRDRSRRKRHDSRPKRDRDDDRHGRRRARSESSGRNRELVDRTATPKNAARRKSETPAASRPVIEQSAEPQGVALATTWRVRPKPERLVKQDLRLLRLTTCRPAWGHPEVLPGHLRTSGRSSRSSQRRRTRSSRRSAPTPRTRSPKVKGRQLSRRSQSPRRTQGSPAVHSRCFVAHLPHSWCWMPRRPMTPSWRRNLSARRTSCSSMHQEGQWRSRQRTSMTSRSTTPGTMRMLRPVRRTTSLGRTRKADVEPSWTVKVVSSTVPGSACAWMRNGMKSTLSWTQVPRSMMWKVLKPMWRPRSSMRGNATRTSLCVYVQFWGKPGRKAMCRRLFPRSSHLQEFQRKLNWSVCDLDSQSILKQREDGDHWDLSKDSHIEDLFTLLDKEKPKLLGGSPPCGPFSQLQNLVDARNQVPASVRSKRLQEGKKHLRTSVRAYRAQMDAGRYFLHEHPKGARSWEEPEVEELRKDPRVYEVTGPMCRWKMESSDAWGKGLVKKETRWLTNSRHIATILSGVCSNVEGKTWHRHVNLINGRARSAQVYPPLLVRGILEALRNQLAEDGEFSQALNSLGAGPVPDAVPVIDEEQEVYDSLPPADLPVAGPVYDSNTGAELDLAKVAAARREELDWVQKQCIYKKVPAEQARAAGKVPITMKWVDRNKGDLERPNYRSRIVCREIKRSKNADYIPEHASFSAMPPLEALKMLLSLMVTLRTSKRNRKPLKLRLLDISRAHFYGHAQREIFVTLPEGDQEEGMVGLLLKSMYGTRDAAHIWQQSYTDVLLAAGFKRSAAWPAIFFHERLEARLLVHGDDFVILGDDAAQEFVEKALREKYDLRVDGSIGVGEAKQEFCVLNRLVRFDERSGSIFYEPDPRHAEILLKDLGMETCKPVKSPNEKLTAEALAKRLELDVVDPHRISQYRSLTMRAAFLAQDRPDLSETVKCLARKMQGPTEADFGDLKRLARYLKGKMRMVQKFTPQKFSNVVSVHADSDFAGCLLTRKSATGLVCYYGRHTLRHSSNLQSTVSLSSGESEYYALVKAVASGMATQELLRSWGINVNLQVYTDSAAALGTCNRLGLGKSRHIQTRYLWIQEKLAERSFELIKIDTKLNTADICTKALASEAAERHLKAMGFEVVQGRSSIAKAVV